MPLIKELAKLLVIVAGAVAVITLMRYFGL